MSASEAKPSAAPVLELLNAFRASASLLTAVSLGVFECLASAPSGLSAKALAKAVATRNAGGTAAGSDVSCDGLERLCRACTSLDLLHSLSPGSFALTPVSATYLVSSSPDALTGYCFHSQQTGSHVWQQQYGGTGADIFSRIYATPPDVLRFMRGMHAFAQLSAAAVVKAFDLGWVRSMVDLGGATGAIARAACEAYPGLQSAVVVDLPHVVATVTQHFADVPCTDAQGQGAAGEGEAAGEGGAGAAGAGAAAPGGGGPPGTSCGGRVRWLAADFFGEAERLPQQADLVVLARILHDWDPPRCAQVLKVAHGLLRPGGCVLVAEMLLHEDRLGPTPALLQDLNMLVQTHGRERSPSEYAALLEAAGFEGVQAARTGTYLDAVLGRKPGP